MASFRKTTPAVGAQRFTSKAFETRPSGIRKLRRRRGRSSAKRSCGRSLPDRAARLIRSATVDEAKSIAYGAYQLDTGESVICSVPLSPEELAAYRRHPDTFFGAEIKASRGGIKTPPELFYFLLGGFKDIPTERLLEVMAEHPDIEELKEFSREDLVEIYAEGCANAVLHQ